MLSDLDTRKNEIIEVIRNAEYNDFQDMDFRTKLTYHEVEEILDTKYIDT